MSGSWIELFPSSEDFLDFLFMRGLFFDKVLEFQPQSMLANLSGELRMLDVPIDRILFSRKRIPEHLDWLACFGYSPWLGYWYAS